MNEPKSKMSADLKLPWRWDYRENRIKDANGDYVGIASQEKVQVIVTAVNERESLRTALKNAVNEMEAAIIAYESMGYHSLAIGTKKRITTAIEALKGE